MERIDKGVKKELIPLVKLRGIGRMRGRIIYNAGYKSVKDLKSAALKDLTELPLIGAKLAKSIKGEVGGLVKKKEWEKIEELEEGEQRALTEY